MAPFFGRKPKGTGKKKRKGKGTKDPFTTRGQRRGASPDALKALEQMGAGGKPKGKGGKERKPAPKPKPAGRARAEQRLAGLLERQGMPKKPAESPDFIKSLEREGFRKPEALAQALQRKLDAGKPLTQIIAGLRRRKP